MIEKLKYDMNIIEGLYRPQDDFFAKVKGLENEKEGGKRCYLCYDIRIGETAKKAKEAGAIVIHYGNFINEILSFFITAFILFLLVYQTTKLTSKFKKDKKEEVKKEKRICPYCKTEVHLKATKCPACTSKL